MLGDLVVLCCWDDKTFGSRWVACMVRAYRWVALAVHEESRALFGEGRICWELGVLRVDISWRAEEHFASGDTITSVQGAVMVDASPGRMAREEDHGYTLQWQRSQRKRLQLEELQWRKSISFQFFFLIIELL